MPSPRRIDIHFHLIPKFYQEAVYAAGAGPAIGRYPDWSPQLALERWTPSASTSRSPRWRSRACNSAIRKKPAALARRCNDYSAELNACWPRRFGAFATLPMSSIGEAVAEIEHSLDQLQHQGVCLFASYGEKFLGDPLFDPVLEVLNDRDAVVFVHPAYHPSSRTLDLPWPGFMMEYPFDTTRAAVNLVFSGAIVRYPRIKFILPHAGGLMPYFAWRLSVSPMIDKRLEQMTRDEVYARLRRFWYDNALAPTAETFDCLNRRGEARPDRVRQRLALCQCARDRRGGEDIRSVAMPQDAARRHRSEQRLVAFPAVRLTV